MNRKRKFSSYGPIDLEYEYGVPRRALIERAVNQLVGESPVKGGHYFTVWAPRQTGKTWVLQNALRKLLEDERYYTIKCNLQVGDIGEDPVATANYIIDRMNGSFELSIPKITAMGEFQDSFSRRYLSKPMILILDEFDSLEPHTIQKLVGEFRNMYIRGNEPDGGKDRYAPMLHGLALIGVRSVLGVENPKGLPFNVQRSMRIPNLTFDEVRTMFDDYQEEYGQQIDTEVVDKLCYETAGQPGLVSWFGELLTESYNPGLDEAITMWTWNRTWGAATQTLPDNNALNIIAKAKDPAYKPTVLNLFQTEEKIRFTFDNPDLNYLYMNGVIAYEDETDPITGQHATYTKFSSPYIQKRLFNRFSADLYEGINAVLDPFDEYKDVFVGEELELRPVFRRYEKWLAKNAWHLFKDVPRRSDMRIYEAVYHFNIYHYLASSLRSRGVSVVPEFPTGNGKIDLLLYYKNRRYGLELKSFSDKGAYHKAVQQAARYGKSLGLSHIDLLFFIDAIDGKHRGRYETDAADKETGVRVIVSFVATGSGTNPIR